VIQHQNDPFVSPHTLPKRQIRAQIELSQSKARGGKKERKEKKEINTIFSRIACHARPLISWA